MHYLIRAGVAPFVRLDVEDEFAGLDGDAWPLVSAVEALVRRDDTGAQDVLN